MTSTDDKLKPTQADIELANTILADLRQQYPDENFRPVSNERHWLPKLIAENRATDTQVKHSGLADELENALNAPSWALALSHVNKAVAALRQAPDAQKLAEALAYMLRVFDESNIEKVDDVHLMVRQSAQITSVADCRAALDGVKVDVKPDSG